ncbi:hypothetical protein ACRE_037520 [Hapsidospora chrysogenum ATCC 11550]|uniref:Extracellular membrane protein CFEM domain-containing protein n=1 Tax=Hapsidospora chrysogenum (strain ATCC 11550 / CBS 779.69 / DSM 880 / IAM 14645 / JCM 23072 / IMI 49137) TaxID=857340 RepID=A0A086T7S6_HAPC1|nr:hypothetical protein ACRE_037520 [Hapsidospora chrysogenum ATCC 11550]
MRHAQSLLSALGSGVALLAPIARAADDSAVPVDEITAFKLLAPCAATALSYAIDAQTQEADCGPSPEELQSCICSDDGLRDDVGSSIKSDISSRCGPFSVDADLRSATRVFNQFCSPDKTVEFDTPTENIVTDYITDLDEIKHLGPCASSGLAAAIGELIIIKQFESRCPEPVSLFAPCICGKENFDSQASKSISLSVSFSCGGYREDIDSAYIFYKAYCAMNDGTTSFPAPSSPEGDMSYHITALPQFQSLNQCAQSGLSSAVLKQSTWRCPSGVQELASCACFKAGAQPQVSSLISSRVTSFCDRSATADVASALDVFDYYCRAAAGDVVAEVSESIGETYPTAESRTGSGDSGPEETGGGSSGEGGDGGGGVNKTAVIAASVLGGVVGIALIVGVGLYVRRRKKRASRRDPTADPSHHFGTPELHDEAKSNTAAGSSELTGQGIVELPPAQPGASELPGGQHHQAYELPTAPYEMDSGWRRG